MVLGVSPIFGKLRIAAGCPSPKSSGVCWRIAKLGVVGGRPRFREFPPGGGVATSGSETWLVDTNEQWNWDLLDMYALRTGRPSADLTHIYTLAPLLEHQSPRMVGAKDPCLDCDNP